MDGYVTDAICLRLVEESLFKKKNLNLLVKLLKLSLIENISTDDYDNSFDSGMVIYDVYEYDFYTDSTTIIDFVELPIPSMDDYIRNVMSFIDKTAKLVQIDFDQIFVFNFTIAMEIRMLFQINLNMNV